MGHIAFQDSKREEVDEIAKRVFLSLFPHLTLISQIQLKRLPDYSQYL